MSTSDVIIVGAGAAGLFCAIEAAKRGRRVLVLEGSNKPGKKILMSGGGRCNFTNYAISAECFLSHNPHFCKSALSRYTQWDFIELVKQYNIPFHEKTLGQLFCDNKASDILNMLLEECKKHDVTIQLNAKIEAVQKTDERFKVMAGDVAYSADKLVIASGGLSIPTMGASDFAYLVAKQFGLKVWPTRAGLVPFTLSETEKQCFEDLPGISMDSVVSCGNNSFKEGFLFTHRGISGPSILQISSYWNAGDLVNVNFLPDVDLFELLKHEQSKQPAQLLKVFLNEYFPKRFLTIWVEELLLEQRLSEISHETFRKIASDFQNWQVKPVGTEGYRTAEVTLGGVDCDALSSKTMEVNNVPGLYFIGEAVDVTGWLGGYNFQWAWSSAWAAGQVV